jgi:hypothetical protein
MPVAGLVNRSRGRPPRPTNLRRAEAATALGGGARARGRSACRSARESPIVHWAPGCASRALEALRPLQPAEAWAYPEVRGLGKRRRKRNGPVSRDTSALISPATSRSPGRRTAARGPGRARGRSFDEPGQAPFASAGRTAAPQLITHTCT